MGAEQVLAEFAPWAAQAKLSEPITPSLNPDVHFSCLLDMFEPKPALPGRISLPWQEAPGGQGAAKEEKSSCLWQKQTPPCHSHSTRDGKTANPNV